MKIIFQNCSRYISWERIGVTSGRWLCCVLILCAGLSGCYLGVLDFQHQGQELVVDRRPAGPSTFPHLGFKHHSNKPACMTTWYIACL